MSVSSPASFLPPVGLQVECSGEVGISFRLRSSGMGRGAPVALR